MYYGVTLLLQLLVGICTFLTNGVIAIHIDVLCEIEANVQNSSMKIHLHFCVENPQNPIAYTK